MSKSILSILLSLILCFSVFSFVGCESEEPDEDGFFSQTKLENCSIPDLPRIEKSKGETKLENGMFYFKTTKSEYDEYLNSVYEYLNSCEFSYFGTAKEELSSFFGGAPKYSFEQGTELNDFINYLVDYSQSDYFFVWGNELENKDNLEEGENPQILGARYLITGFWEGEDLVYNAFIKLPFGLLDATFYVVD